MLAVALLAGSSLAFEGGGGAHAPRGWWFGPLIGGLVFLVLIGVLVWAVLRRPGPGEPDPTRSAHRILSERFARGEIDEDEYLERRSRL